jgi:hypothetical protein
MSATIDFSLEARSPEPTVGGPFSGYTCLMLQAGSHVQSPTLKLFAKDDQLAAIAKAILAHLERQEQGDFEQEVA